MLQSKCDGGGDGEGGFQIRPEQGESGKHRWPLQMSCDLRPRRGGSPVRPCGMCCQRRAGGENLRRLMGVCVYVCVGASACRQPGLHGEQAQGKGMRNVYVFVC